MVGLLPPQAWLKAKRLDQSVVVDIETSGQFGGQSVVSSVLQLRSLLVHSLREGRVLESKNRDKGYDFPCALRQINKLKIKKIFIVQ